MTIPACQAAATTNRHNQHAQALPLLAACSKHRRGPNRCASNTAHPLCNQRCSCRRPAAHHSCLQYIVAQPHSCASNIATATCWAEHGPTPHSQLEQHSILVVLAHAVLRNPLPGYQPHTAAGPDIARCCVCVHAMATASVLVKPNQTPTPAPGQP